MVVVVVAVSEVVVVVVVVADESTGERISKPSQHLAKLQTRMQRRLFGPERPAARCCEPCCKDVVMCN